MKQAIRFFIEAKNSIRFRVRKSDAKAVTSLILINNWQAEKAPMGRDVRFDIDGDGVEILNILTKHGIIISHLDEAKNELISTSKDIKAYKGKTVPKGKYEVINARGKFATLMRIHDKVDGGSVYNLVPLDTLSSVSKKINESVNEAKVKDVLKKYVKNPYGIGAERVNDEGKFYSLLFGDSHSREETIKKLRSKGILAKKMRKMMQPKGVMFRYELVLHKESINEADGDLNDLGYKKIKAGFKYLDNVVKKLQAAVKKEDSEETIKSIKGLNDIAGIMYDMIGVGRFYESINEAVVATMRTRSGTRTLEKKGGKLTMKMPNGEVLKFKDGADVKEYMDRVYGYWSFIKGYGKVKGLRESTAAYEKALQKIAKDKQLSMLSKKDRETLLKVAQLMKSANENKKMNEKVAMPLGDHLSAATKELDYMIKVGPIEDAYDSPKVSLKAIKMARKLLDKVN